MGLSITKAEVRKVVEELLRGKALNVNEVRSEYLKSVVAVELL